MERILVGVDGSPASVQALRRAAEEALLHDATLEVVSVIEPPGNVTAFPVPPSKGRDQPADITALQEQATGQLEAWLDEIDLPLDDDHVEYAVLIDRRPGRALVERSKRADLVVVGSRGRGGFAGLRLGSVTEQVTRHANAPVLVIRESTSG